MSFTTQKSVSFFMTLSGEVHVHFLLIFFLNNVFAIFKLFSAKFSNLRGFSFEQNAGRFREEILVFVQGSGELKYYDSSSRSDRDNHSE